MIEETVYQKIAWRVSALLTQGKTPRRVVLGRAELAALQAEGRVTKMSETLRVLALNNLDAPATRSIGRPFATSQTVPVILQIERVDEPSRFEVSES